MKAAEEPVNHYHEPFRYKGKRHSLFVFDKTFVSGEKENRIEGLFGVITSFDGLNCVFQVSGNHSPYQVSKLIFQNLEHLSGDRYSIGFRTISNSAKSPQIRVFEYVVDDMRDLTITAYDEFLKETDMRPLSGVFKGLMKKNRTPEMKVLARYAAFLGMFSGNEGLRRRQALARYPATCLSVLRRSNRIDSLETRHKFIKDFFGRVDAGENPLFFLHELHKENLDEQSLTSFLKNVNKIDSAIFKNSLYSETQIEDLILSYLNPNLLSKVEIREKICPENIDQITNLLNNRWGTISSETNYNVYAGNMTKEVPLKGWRDHVLDLAREIMDYVEETKYSLASTLLLKRLWRDAPEALLMINEDLATENPERAGKFLSLFNTIDFVGKGDYTSVKYSSLRAASKKWHKSGIREIKFTNDHVSWSPLLGNMNISGCDVREILNKPDLITQGKSEGHCVGSYLRLIMRDPFTEERIFERQGSVIFSIENGDEILSTLELETVSDAVSAIKEKGTPQPMFRIGQNLGKKNADPCEKAEEVAAAVLNKVNGLSIKEVQEYFGQFSRREANQVYDRLCEHFCADLLSREDVEDAHGHNFSFLPREMQAMDEEAMFKTFVSERAYEKILVALQEYEAEKTADNGLALFPC